MPWLEERLILFEGYTEIRRYEPRVAEGGSLQVRARKSLKRGSYGVVHNTLVVRQHHWQSHMHETPAKKPRKPDGIPYSEKVTPK